MVSGFILWLFFMLPRGGADQSCEHLLHFYTGELNTLHLAVVILTSAQQPRRCDLYVLHINIKFIKACEEGSLLTDNR